MAFAAFRVPGMSETPSQQGLYRVFLSFRAYTRIGASNPRECARVYVGDALYAHVDPETTECPVQATSCLPLRHSG